MTTKKTTDAPARLADLIIERMRNRTRGIPLAFKTPDQPLYLCRLRFIQPDAIAAEEALQAVQAYAAQLGICFENTKRLGGTR